MVALYGAPRKLLIAYTVHKFRVAARTLGSDNGS